VIFSLLSPKKVKTETVIWLKLCKTVLHGYVLGGRNRLSRPGADRQAKLLFFLFLGGKSVVLLHNHNKTSANRIRLHEASGRESVALFSFTRVRQCRQNELITWVKGAGKWVQAAFWFLICGTICLIVWRIGVLALS
jgi:hypothetical protein